MALVQQQARCLITFILLIGFAQSKQWFHDVKATSLTPETFEASVGKQDHVMIEFFTPWCGYCQQMMGEWNKLFSHYEEDQATRKDVKICKVNCEEHKEFCAQIGVRQFPTIKLYIAGSKETVHFYQGNRRFEDFKHWITHHIAPKEAQQEDQLMQQRQQEQQQNIIQQQMQQQQQQLLQQQLLKQQQETAEKTRIEEAKMQQEWVRQRQEELKKLEEMQKKQEVVEQHHQEDLNRLEEIERILVSRGKQQNNDKNTKESLATETKNPNGAFGNNENTQDIMKTVSSLGERITMLSGKIQKIEKINGNIEDVMRKLEIVAADQKLIQKQMLKMLEMQENLQKVATSQQGGEKDIERLAEQKGQQQQTVIPVVSSHSISRQSFSVLPAVLFLLAGSALGYLFFSFRSNKASSRSSLLVSQSSQEQHKSN